MRDFAFWLPLAAGSDSRNLGPFLLRNSVLSGFLHWTEVAHTKLRAAANLAHFALKSADQLLILPLLALTRNKTPLSKEDVIRAPTHAHARVYQSGRMGKCDTWSRCIFRHQCHSSARVGRGPRPPGRARILVFIWESPCDLSRLPCRNNELSHESQRRQCVRMSEQING